MANSYTEHSKQLRRQHAKAHTKMLRETGQVKQIALQLPTELALEFDEILKELGDSRPKGIKALCEFYKAHR